MNEKFLLKLVLLISVLGLILLYMISRNVVVDDTTIEKITNEEIEGKVVVNGIVKEINTKGNTTVLVIGQESDIKVIVFSNINLSKGEVVKIFGKVSEYNDEKEIIAEKIEKI